MKNKKHKKERKKHKKEKYRRKDDSSEDSSGEEMEWVESSDSSAPSVSDKTCAPSPDTTSLQPTPKDVPKYNKEDDWLESPFLTAATSLADIRKKKDEEQEKEKEKNKSPSCFDAPGQSARELNPFWKDGGTGLPEEEQSSQNKPSPVVRKVGRGVDGGISWLKRSFQRAVEQAKESGRSVEQVVTERWGSMAEYKRLLAEAEEAVGGRSHPRSTGMRGPHGGPPGWKNRRDEDESYRGGDRDGRRDNSSYDRDGRLKEQSSYGRYKMDDKRREDKSDSRERGDRFEVSSGRDKSDRGFVRPGDRNRDRDTRGSDDMRSKFKRPGDDGDGYKSRMDRSGSGPYGRGSSSQERRRDEDVPSWRKGGFKKPGEQDSESSGGSRSSSSRSYAPPPAPSSSSSGGWRKAGFKRPGDEAGTDSPSGMRSSRDPPDSDPSSAEGLRESGFRQPRDDKESLRRSPVARDRPFRPSASSSSRASRRRSSDSESDSDGDDVRSPSSSSPDTRSSGRERSEEREKERSPSPVKILSDTEMNQLGAKLIKAEIMGNETQVEKLKAQIEAARQARITHKTKLLEGKEVDKGQKRARGGTKEEEEVILTRTDRSGQSWPLAEATAPPDSGKKKRKKNIVTHDKGGERERYFADDDEMDLDTMVRREKMGSVDDHNKLLNKVASKKLALLDSEFNTLDEMFVSSAAKAESKSKTEERERSRAIAEHRRTMATLSKCPFCLESGEMKKHLIISLGLKVYLCVPETRCISEGQCYIVPMQHTVASTAMDEDVWAEIQVFRKGLTRMYEDHEMDVCFLETCMNPKKQRHMCIECIPVPRELGEMAPIYFKKAIQESESEWSQNKKLVDTRQKDIRRSIPRGFPFFSVDFGLDGGFAHVIEDELIFPHYFGKEVIGGLLDVEPRLWRHPPRENFEDQSKRVLQLSQWWKPFDWTQKIDREKS